MPDRVYVVGVGMTKFEKPAGRVTRGADHLSGRGTGGADHLSGRVTRGADHLSGRVTRGADHLSGRGTGGADYLSGRGTGGADYLSGRVTGGADHEASREGWDYPDMAREAGSKALADAGIDYREVEEAYVGYVYGESTSGQRALYELGMTGIPVVNVNNNCSTGSTALYLAARAIRGGLAQCALALGFEKMQPGSLGAVYDDRAQPMEKHILAMAEISEVLFPPAPWMFGAAGREHMKQYGSTAEHFAKIGHKNHKHSVNNPYAQFQVEYSLDDILGARMIYDPLTKLQCSPTSDGSGAAILASEAFVDEHGLADRAVEIVGQSMVTDFENSFDATCKGLIGHHMNVQAAQRVYDQSGLGPEDFQVIELHDCFSANELLLYEALGLCGDGEAPRLIDDGDTTYGGRWVVNPSGGLISKGHPLGATGLAQCAELTWQLRGAADERQVDGVTAALQHNIGLGGAAVVTAYQRAER